MKRSSRQTMIKLYAQAVISELQQLGYPNGQAKEVFFRHYRDMKRLFGLEQNVCDFAKMMDEFERAMQKKHDLSDPNSIAVGHLKHLAQAYIHKHKSHKRAGLKRMDGE
ncbi:hypothetical protein [Paenibacillus sp. tmac-D7]|uniref:hypothetical protein n=1 Tax=Paenibacillus sp. tmac-D7 TaxID=2591462 RepID=UPI0015E831CD|nr:hypothetical protein [Paenibacillus sp. tmac-D7]